jgi:hypothetical protein
MFALNAKIEVKNTVLFLEMQWFRAFLSPFD